MTLSAASSYAPFKRRVGVEILLASSSIDQVFIEPVMKNSLGPFLRYVTCQLISMNERCS